MFPIRINVLSESKKTHLKRLSLFAYLKTSVTAVFIFTCVLAGLLFVIEKFITQLDTQSSNLTSATDKTHLNTQIEEIREINTRLQHIDSIQKKHITWSPILHHITEATPEGIELSSFTIDSTTNILSITGVAYTRDTLESYEQTLKNLEIVETLTLPPSDLTRRENISFAMQILLKPNMGL